MAFCKNCGAEITDGVKFCKSCGTPVADAPVNETAPLQNTAQPQGTPVQNIAPAPAAPKKLSKNQIIGIAVAVAVVIIGIIAYSIIQKNAKTVNIEDYIKVDFSGYDGHGSASAYIDDTDFTSAVKKAMGKKYTTSSTQLGDDFITYYIEYSIEVSCKPSSDLSNGDKVTVNIKYSKSLGDNYGITLKGDSVEFTVEDLEEVEDYNPMDDVEVVFDGIAPNVYASVNYTGDKSFLDSYCFSLSSTYDIDVNDTVTVTLDDYYVETALSSYGINITETSKEFTCENADSYFTTAADISDDNLEELKTNAKDYIDADLVNESSSHTFSDITYVGYYFLNSKGTSSWSDDNRIYVIYSAKVGYTNKKGKSKSTTVYFPIYYYNVVNKADGTITYSNSSYISGYSYIDNDESWSSVPGYLDGTDMYNNLIVANKGDFTYEVSDDLTSFGE